ncbi:MAG: alpha/beta hydrolase [Deltaproteobacteria bacterium]|nr:alpha/beta hydrolase [Deltaproteobacteria bacterium]
MTLSHTPFGSNPSALAMHGLLCVVGVVAASCGCLPSVADGFLFQPPRATYADSPELTRLTTSDGVRISALYLPNPNAQITLLFSHGNGEDLGMARDSIDQLHKLGFAVLAYDYHGYGTSGGSPSEGATRLDIDAVYDHLTGPLAVPPSRIIVYGRSLGGGPSTELASRRPVGGLVLEATFVTAVRVVTDATILPIERYPNIDRIRNVRCPVFIMHGVEDGVVPLWHGEDLIDAANEPKFFWAVPGARHLRVMRHPHYARMLQGFAAYVAMRTPQPGASKLP